MSGIQIVSSVGVVSYGWDQPIVSCAILASPTQSLGLHLQKLGRVLRPWPAPAVSTPGPRPYQSDLIERLFTAIRAGVRRILLWLPTGAGKGWIAGRIIDQYIRQGKTVGMIVNRRTLVNDLSKRLDGLGIDHSIIMGSHPRRRPWLRTFVGSIDTLHRREALPKCDLLFLDECHFAISPIWHKVIGRYADVPLIGMTATPERADGRPLGGLFEQMISGPSVESLIADGYLVGTRVFAPPPPDLTGVKTAADGDYNQKQLAAAVDRRHLVGDIVEHWLQHGENRKTVVFPVNREHSRHIVERFVAAGVNAVHVDCDTSDAERERIWAGLNEGSSGLSPKQDALVLDHAGNTLRLGFAEEEREWELSRARVKRELKERDYEPGSRTCDSCQALYSSTRPLCPKCGAKPTVELIKNIDGTLQELPRNRKLFTADEIRQWLPQHQRGHFYDNWLAQADRNGNGPEWADQRYLEVFGERRSV